MLAERLCSCSGSAWLRPDGGDATQTTIVLPPNAEAASSKPADTKACEFRPPSTPRESSPSLERRKAVRGRRFRTPLLRGFDVLAFGANGREKSVGEKGEGYVTVEAVPASHLIVGQSHFPLRLLAADLHPPAHPGRLRQHFERGTLGSEDRVGGEFV